MKLINNINNGALPSGAVVISLKTPAHRGTRTHTHRRTLTHKQKYKYYGNIEDKQVLRIGDEDKTIIWKHVWLNLWQIGAVLHIKLVACIQTLNLHLSSLCDSRRDNPPCLIWTSTWRKFLSSNKGTGMPLHTYLKKSIHICNIQEYHCKFWQ